ncbi:MAG: hypothetical protein U0R50_14485 [Gaiellales bacterium]
MKIRAVAIAVIVCATLTPTVRATARPDPKEMSLKVSDFPAGASVDYEHADEKASLPGGLHGRLYATTYRFAVGRKTEVVNSIVIVAGSARQARTIYGAAVRDNKAQNAPLQHQVLRVRRFGDEQYAVLLGDVAVEETQVQLWVRHDAVVWMLYVNTDPTAADSGLSKPRALAELSKYGSKLQRRVGKG